MKILPIDTIKRNSDYTQNQTAFKCCYPNLSNKILNFSTQCIINSISTGWEYLLLPLFVVKIYKMVYNLNRIWWWKLWKRMI